MLSPIRTAAALGLAPDLTLLLLGRVMHGVDTALQRLLELAAVDAAQPLTRSNAAPQFEILEKLLKVASVIRTLACPASQLDWLFRENPWLAVAPDPASAASTANWFSLVEFQTFKRTLGLQDAAIEALLGTLTAVALASTPAAQPAAKQGFAAALSSWLGCRPPTSRL